MGWSASTSNAAIFVWALYFVTAPCFGSFRSGKASSGDLLPVGQGSVPPHDLTAQSQLRNLYNQRVASAELVTRPMGSFSVPVGAISHSGVRVTLEDGSKYLIHKGKDYGVQSQTVVVDAKHMSQNWQVTQSKTVEGKSVGDYVKEGGANYNLLTDNCRTAAGKMMKK